MKRINQPIIALVAVGMFSAPSWAAYTVDHSNYPIYSHGNGVTITATPFGEGFGGGIAGILGPVYSNMLPGPGGFAAFAPATGSLGFDDYDSILNATITMDAFRFIGGVAGHCAEQRRWVELERDGI